MIFSYCTTTNWRTIMLVYANLSNKLTQLFKKTMFFVRFFVIILPSTVTGIQFGPTINKSTLPGEDF